MSKVAVVYWSGTGNTQAMANNAPGEEELSDCRSLGEALC